MSTSKFARPADRSAFEIAIICALRKEANAVEATFDEYWEDTDDHQYDKAPGDPNSYTLGRIGRHNVVLALMPGMGKAASASLSAYFRASFPNIRLGLVVGISGGVPKPADADADEIFLGDVIVSTGVIQIDFGRQYENRLIRKDTLEDNLGRSNLEIRGYLQKLQGLRAREKLLGSMSTNIANVIKKRDFRKWKRPPPEEDKLYSTTYRHKHQDPSACETCARCLTSEDDVCEDSLVLPCTELGCDEAYLMPPNERKRPSVDSDIDSDSDADADADTKPEASPQPASLTSQIHFGLIASSDAVMKSARHRDEIARRENILGFEMEGAGVWDNFPTIVIKSVCDYADSHKNKVWQNYCSVVAAACAKGMLVEWRGIDRTGSGGLGRVTSGVISPGVGGGPDSAIFNNHAPVQNQAKDQTINGGMYFGDMYQSPRATMSGTNWGSQVGYNYGSVSNNDYRSRSDK